MSDGPQFEGLPTQPHVQYASAAAAEYARLSSTTQLTPEEAAETQAALAARERATNAQNRSLLIGSATLGAGGAAAIYVGINKDIANGNVAQQTPFVEEVQKIINNVDTAMVHGGEVLVAGAFIAAAANKAMAIKRRKNTEPSKRTMRALASERRSSRDPSETPKAKQGPLKKTSEALLGARPALPIVFGSYIAGLAACTGFVVSENPQRAVEEALAQGSPADTIVLGYKGAISMTESNLRPDFANAIVDLSRKNGTEAYTFDQSLGALEKQDGQILYGLTFGFKMPEGSPLKVDTKQQYPNGYPVGVDKNANIDIGTKLKLNGVPVTVVEHIEGTSAINRVGFVADQTLIANKFDKSDAFESPVSAVLVNAPVEEVKATIEATNQDETHYVSTVDEYLGMSKMFWESNIKPITSVLALGAMAFAGVVSSSRMRMSLLQNRQVIAERRGNAARIGGIRRTESLRAVKEGLYASMIGGTIAVVSTPPLLNLLESGMRASAGAREFFISGAVGVGGAVLASIKNAFGLEKTIKVEESLGS